MHGEENMTDDEKLNDDIGGGPLDSPEPIAEPTAGDEEAAEEGLPPNPDAKDSPENAS